VVYKFDFISYLPVADAGFIVAFDNTNNYTLRVFFALKMVCFAYLFL